MLGSFLWLFAAFANSVLAAQNVEMNRQARQEGFRLNMWRMTLSALFWMPLALLQHWPQDPMFYVAAIFGGIVLIVGFTIQTDLSQKHNGRVAILHTPLKAMVVFIIWAMIDREARMNVLDDPWRIAGEMICLAIMVGSLFTFRKHDVSWSSFKAILPVVVLYSASDILTRLTMGPSDLAEKLIIFMFVMSASSSLGSMLVMPWRPQPQLPLITKALIKSGGWAAFGSTLSQSCFLIALVLAPSPAYVSMVALLAPVWLLIYHRLKGIKDDASPVAGTVLVMGAFMLMALSAS